MGWTKIDRTRWKREAFFRHYHEDAPCFYSMTVSLDVTRLRAAGRLAPGALAILERAEARAISLPEGFSLRDARRYGETCVEFVVEGEEA